VKANLLVVGLVRDCAKTLLANIKLIGAALSDFNEVKWLIVESDSSDQTVETLTLASSLLPGFDFVSLGNLRENIPARTERIAYCRNAYLDQVRQNDKYSDVDYVIVADFDGINTHLTSAGISSCFDRSGWSVCTANQDGPYYDVYALRHDVWCPDDWWSQHYFALGLGLADRESVRFACYSKMIKIPQRADWIEVNSAFGGFAIYRRDCLLNADSSYDGLDMNGVGICEHVPFHASLRSSGHKIFINPRLINAKYTEHTRQLVGREQLVHDLKSLMNIVKVRTLNSFYRYY
jgi:hypothetical protein